MVQHTSLLLVRFVRTPGKILNQKRGKIGIFWGQRYNGHAFGCLSVSAMITLAWWPWVIVSFNCQLRVEITLLYSFIGDQ